MFKKSTFHRHCNALLTDIHKLNPWLSKRFIHDHYKSFRRDGLSIPDAIRATDHLFCDAYKTYKSTFIPPIGLFRR